jgi:DnaJ like chaperone protein
VAAACLRIYQPVALFSSKGKPLHGWYNGLLMGWWGKIVGGAFGFLVGGPLGAVLGAALGHNVDRGLERPFGGPSRRASGSREEIQTVFFTATFCIMGHLCKADGRVSPDEIGLARLVMRRMDLSPDQARAAMGLFNEGKSPGFPLEEVLGQLRHEVRGRRRLLRLFLEIQLAAAYADGALDSAEERILLHICDRLGFSHLEFRKLEAMVRAAGRHRRQQRPEAPPPPRHGLEDAYAILNIPESASDGEVKKAYRRLMSQHHPDKLLAQGLPEEMIKVATEKTRHIRGAYERIREARGS